MLNTSLAEYLGEVPQELRLADLYVEYNSALFRPMEALKGSDSFTIAVTPASPADTGSVLLEALTASSASRANSESWNAPARPSKTVEGHTFQFYRPDETKHITVTSPSGISKTYPVKIIWASAIDHPREIKDDPDGDYYLKPGPKITLNSWTPIGTDDAYTPGIFSGSLRGNRREIEINSFAPSPTASPVECQALFLLLDNAIVEDLHIRLNGVKTNAKNAAGITGIAKRSLIHQVKVSGDISSIITGTETATISAGGIAGTLASGAVIANSIAAADITGFVSLSYGSGCYLGGAAGRQLQNSTTSPFLLDPGGYIINTLALGSVITNTDGGKPSIAGGLSGGGADTSNTDIKGCVAVGSQIDAGSAGYANYILGHWDSPGTSSSNYRRHDLIKVGKPSTGFIEGTSVNHDILKTDQSLYENLGWDFTAVWKMVSGGYPALQWE